MDVASIADVVVAVAMDLAIVVVEMVAVDVVILEEVAVVVQPTVVALGISRARSRLFKSSTLPHTNFSEVRC